MASLRRLLASIVLLLSVFSTNAFLSSHLSHKIVTSTQYRDIMQTSRFQHQPPRSIQSSKSSAQDKKELTPELIAEMIEVSFIQSCLQLASGYVDVLKLFIVAVKAGYEANLPLSKLEKLVEECPVNSANRKLMTEEKELRKEWMMVVYQMMNGLQAGQQKVQGSNQSMERVSNVVSAVLEVRKQLESEEKSTGGKNDANAALAALSISETFSRSDALMDMKKACKDPMETAFLTNDVCVGVLTCKVLEEERLCTESGDSDDVGGQVPRPPIPGT